MEPEADGQSLDVSAVEAAPDPEPGAGSEPAYSIEEAWAEAKAEVAAPETPGAPEATLPEGEAAATPQPADAATEPTAQPATPEPAPKSEAQIREEARQELIREQAAEKRYLETYLELETERQVDPEAFNEKMLADENLYGFYRAYRAAHPDVSLENPSPGPRQAAPDEIRAEIRQSYNEGLQAILSDVANRSGVDFRSLPGVADGKLGTAIDALIAKGVEAGVKSALPKAVEKEREALRVEIQAEFAKTNIGAFKVLGGSPATAPARSGPMTTSEAMRAAFEEAKAELDRAS